jgi:hypothetical protein
MAGTFAPGILGPDNEQALSQTIHVLCAPSFPALENNKARKNRIQVH